MGALGMLLVVCARALEMEVQAMGLARLVADDRVFSGDGPDGAIAQKISPCEARLWRPFSEPRRIFAKPGLQDPLQECPDVCTETEPCPITCALATAGVLQKKGNEKCPEASMFAAKSGLDTVIELTAGVYVVADKWCLPQVEIQGPQKSDERAVLECSSAADSTAVWVVRGFHVAVRRVQIKGCTGEGAVVEQDGELTLEDVEMSEVSLDGIRLLQNAKVELHGSTVHAEGDGITGSERVNSVKIDANWKHAAGEPNVVVKLCASSYVHADEDGIVLRGAASQLFLEHSTVNTTVAGTGSKKNAGDAIVLGQQARCDALESAVHSNHDAFAVSDLTVVSCINCVITASEGDDEMLAAIQRKDKMHTVQLRKDEDGYASLNIKDPAGKPITFEVMFKDGRLHQRDIKDSGVRDAVMEDAKAARTTPSVAAVLLLSLLG